MSWAYDEARARVRVRFSYALDAADGAPAATLFALYPHQRAALVDPRARSGARELRDGAGPHVAPGRRRLRARAPVPGRPAGAAGRFRAPTSRRCGRSSRDDAAVDSGARDTYWAGKELGRLATLHALARQLGLEAEADALEARLRAALESWFDARSDPADPATGGQLSLRPALGHADRLPVELRLGGGAERPPLPLRLLPARGGGARPARSGLARGRTRTAPSSSSSSATSRARAATTRRSPSCASSIPTPATRGPRATPSRATATTRNRPPRRWPPGPRSFCSARSAATARSATSASSSTRASSRPSRRTGSTSRARTIRRTTRAPVVPMIWGGKGAYGTFFSGEPEHLYGINWLPFHGGSLYLGRWPEFAERSYDALVRARGGPHWKTWADLVVMYRALSDPADAARQWQRTRAHGRPRRPETRERTSPTGSRPSLSRGASTGPSPRLRRSTPSSATAPNGRTWPTTRARAP